MSDYQFEQPTVTFTSIAADEQPEQRCIVCDRPSGGKAICSDARCAQELAGL